MYLSTTINFIFLILFLSCSNNNSKINEKEVNQLLTIDSNRIIGNKIINIVLLNDFNDSLKIRLGNVVLSEGLFLTNESTGFCKKRIKLAIDSIKKNELFFYNTKNVLEYKIDIMNVKKYLYVWKLDNVWQHEFSDKVKELE